MRNNRFDLNNLVTIFCFVYRSEWHSCHFTIISLLQCSVHTGRSQRKHMSLVFLSLEHGQKLHLFPDAINDDDVEVNCFEEHWRGISVTPGLLFLFLFIPANGKNIASTSSKTNLWKVRVLTIWYVNPFLDKIFKLKIC